MAKESMVLRLKGEWEQRSVSESAASRVSILDGNLSVLTWGKTVSRWNVSWNLADTYQWRLVSEYVCSLCGVWCGMCCSSCGM